MKLEIPKKRLLLLGLGLAAIVAVVATALLMRPIATAQLEVLVKKGEFAVAVTTSGELQAVSSIEIDGPVGARSAGIFQMKIQRLVDEGTIVKQGDFVAEIDRTELLSKVREAELNIQKAQAQYTQTLLDTMLTMSAARDELTNLRYGVEEKKLQVEQSAYEAPAIKRQNEIALEGAERALKQATTNYSTKKRQAEAKMQQVAAELSKEQQKFEILSQTMQEFTVLSPANGMVIYNREWNGKKRGVGATISPWDPTVATLPDLSKMESVTYVSEIDIQKVKVGQKVAIGLDSDPKKKLSGEVTSVANIGEQRPNSESKVFEVRIKVNESDTTLRPAMTTSNKIRVSKLAGVIYVPLEAVFNEGGKSIVYVIRGKELQKTEVKVGVNNETDVVIVSGLKEGERLSLNAPNAVSDMEAGSKSNESVPGSR